MHFSSLADNPVIVTFAYAAAFLPWTAFAATDFINSTWKSVATTRREGTYNLVFTMVPVAYILFYVFLQARALDYKEMCAAILALTFSVLHFFRTVWGLWQLSTFRNWVAASVVNLRSLDIHYNMGNESDNHQNKEPYAIADAVYVNDSLIDNQILHGEARCYLRYGNVSFRLSSTERGFLRQRLYLLFQFALLLLRWPLDWFRSLLSGTTRTVLRQVPHAPVEMWLNWCVAFASQGLSKSMQFETAEDPDVKFGDGEIFNMERFKKRRDYFAGEVLASAALNFWPNSNTKVISPMLWGSWPAESDICDGRITRGEFLRKAAESGVGLPFDAALRPKEDNSVSGFRPYSRKLQRAVESIPPGIGEPIEHFDIDKFEWLTILLHLGASAETLETRTPTIKSSTDCIAEPYGDEKACSETRSEGESTESDEGDALQCERVKEQAGLDIAVENLLSQLGLGIESSPQSPTVNLARFCAFPLALGCLDQVANCNRMALKTSELIDIWLALQAGHQLSFLFNFRKPWEYYDAQREEDQGVITEAERKLSSQSSPFQATDGSIKKPFTGQSAVETARLDYQFAKLNQRYWHQEATLTFMGYGMEFLRTYLAEWRHNHYDNADSTATWHAKLSSTLHGETHISKKVDVGTLSDSLSASLLGNCNEAFLSRLSIQTRLLWEIQSLLQVRLTASAGAGEGPSSVEAMILCAIGFPSVVLEVREAEDTFGQVEHSATAINVHVDCCEMAGADKDSEEYLCHCNLIISPQCGPQKVSVVLQFQKRGLYLVSVKAFLGIQTGSRDPCFQWEWWKSSFMTRIETLRKWQEDHDLRFVKVSRTDLGIHEETHIVPAGVAHPTQHFLSWSGWRPFRSGLCLFEVKSPGFLRQLKKGGYGEYTLARFQKTAQRQYLSRQSYEDVTYEKVDRDVLRHFSLVVMEVVADESVCIPHGNSSTTTQDTAQELILNAERLITAEVLSPHRALFLLEIAASEYGSMDALTKLVALLTKDSPWKDVTRAVTAIHSFLSLSLKMSPPRLGVGSNDSELSADLVAVRDLIEKVAEGEGFSGSIVLNSVRDMLLISLFLDPGFCCDRGLCSFRKLFMWTRSFAALLYLGNLLLTESVVDQLKQRHTTYSGEYFSRLGMELFNRCSVQGKNPAAFTAIGTVLIEGAEGIEKDVRQAKELYERAIREGHGTEAMSNLAHLLVEGGDGVEPDARRAKELWERAIREGERTNDMFALGNLLRDGGNGVEPDARQAMQMWEPAIREGRNTSAMHNMAQILVGGTDGVEQDAMRAKKLWERAITEGPEIESIFALGNLFWHGSNGVARDTKRAIELWERAIREGQHTGAMCNLGNAFGQGIDGIERDIRRAKELWERAIREGQDTLAMSYLGSLLMNGGDGIERDVRQAAELLERAIGEGQNTVAMCNLAYLLVEGGDGADPDPRRAKELYERAIREGQSTAAMSNLASLLAVGSDGVEQDVRRAMELWERAIRDGQEETAMYGLANLLWNGENDVKRDTRRAIELWEWAIGERHHTESMCRLGEALEEGMDGIERDARRSKELWERAIRDGKSTVAMCDLADMLVNGAEGVDRDVRQAAELLECAIEEGQNTVAMCNLANLLVHGADGVEQDTRRAKELYERAIREGQIVVAMSNLASLLAVGADGVERDVRRAKELWEQAVCEGQSTLAMSNLASLLAGGADGVEQDARRAKELWERVIMEENNAHAMFKLGCLLVNGADGVEQDARRAKELWEQANQEVQHPQAMANLIVLLRDGADGVERDAGRAAELLALLVAQRNC